MSTEKAAPTKSSDLDVAAVIDKTPLAAAYFESFIESISLPFINSIYPYETISNPFDMALFEYLAADIKAFEEKLASFKQSNNPNQPFDFINASYEELLETPVDSGSENLNTVTHQKVSGEVTSEERDLSTSDSFDGITGGFNSPFVVSRSPFEQVTSTSLSLGGSLSVGGVNYLANISQGPFQAPSTFSVNVAPPPEQGFALRVAVDNDAFDFAAAFGKARNLLEKVAFVRGESVVVDGVSPNLNGPFFLKDIIDPNPLLLKFAEILSVNKNGGFTFLAHNTIPQAETFFFQVNELDRRGNIIDQKVSAAHISEIQDQAYTMILNDGLFTAQGNVTLSSNTGLLANGAAAGDAVLSVLLINPILNSADPLADTYEMVIPSMSFQEFSFNFDNTTLSLMPDGSFIFSTTADIPLTLNFVVSDGLGQMALASAVFTPLVTPVVLDLTGNGIDLVSPENSPITLGSLTGSSSSTPVGWIGDGNGILMYDPNDSDVLSNLNQISFVSYVPGAQTDLAGLSAFDSNHNGYLDSSDLNFNHFDVLLANGKVESLSDLDIVSISLDSNNNLTAVNGNTIFGETTYQTSDGQSHVAADVGLGVGIAVSQEAAKITEQLAQAGSETLL